MKKTLKKKQRPLRALLGKSAQIHMIETIAVLFIFFILVLFGMIFYYQYQKSAIAEKQEAVLEKRAMETTLKVLFLPELICSSPLQEEQEDNCFDWTKLQHARELFQPALISDEEDNMAGDDEKENRERKRYYADLFSYAKIEVRQLTPEVQEPLVIYNLPKPNSSSEPTYFIIIIKDEIKNQNYFGYLNVTVYS